MLCADNVHRLLTRFTEKGWNSREAANALASEIEDGSAGQGARAKNKELIDRSDGLLPSMHVEEAQILTIAGSHTTTVLRLVAAAGDGQYRIISTPRLCDNNIT